MNAYIWIFGSVLVICSTVVIIYITKKRQERYLFGTNGPSKKNKLLKDILNTAFTKKTIEESCKDIIDKLLGYFNLNYVSIMSLDNEEGKLKVVSTNIPRNQVKDIEQYAAIQFTNEIVKKGGSKSAGTIEFCKEGCLPYPTAETREIKYSYFVPLSTGNELIGALLVESTEYEPEGLEKKQEHEFFKTILNYISVAFQALLYQEKINHIAWYDTLTGIHNRAYMWEDIKTRLKCQDNNVIVSIAFFDIDKFKNFNDTYGHETGDLVLKAVTKEVKNSLRDCDNVYRYGGEEFIIYIDNMDSNSSYSYVDRIRRNLENMRVTNSDGTQLKVTSSFGIAEYPLHHNSIEKVINYADEALYVSKSTGRNKVTIYIPKTESED